MEFSKYKKRITDVLEGRDLGIDEEISLINGFFDSLIFKDLSDEIVLFGPTIPLIIAVGETSGRVYVFALKHVLPDLDV